MTTPLHNFLPIVDSGGERALQYFRLQSFQSAALKCAPSRLRLAGISPGRRRHVTKEPFRCSTNAAHITQFHPHLANSKEQAHVSRINAVANATNIARNPVPRKRRKDLSQRYPKITEIRSGER